MELKKQEYAYSLMKTGKNVFITGGGGVGKSHVINRFIQEYRPIRKIGITSTTGISALLIGGSTLHSYLGIGLGEGTYEAVVKRIKNNKLKVKRWKELQTLIIDEVSMLTPELFDKLEYIARTLRRNSQPFGGIQLILSGDFLQLPCVNTDNFCFEANTWKTCVTHIVHLDEIVRQSDKQFQECLSAIRMGEIKPEHREYLEQCIGKKLKNEIGIKPTLLFPKNHMVDNYNTKMLEKEAAKSGEIIEYEMVLEKHKPDPKDLVAAGYVNEEILSIMKEYEVIPDKLIKNCPAVENLQLTLGCQVMLLINLDIESGLVNGSRGIVSEFVEGIPVVSFMNGIKILIDFHTWEFKKDEFIVATLTQIPLRLGYSFSIHKSQGSTIDLVEMDLSDVFEYGMAYVALSRVKDISGLSIRNICWEKIKAHPKAIEFYKNL